MRSVRVHEFGEPSVLRVEQGAAPRPAAGQVLIDVEVAGVAYGDTIVRSGRFPVPLPYVPGLEVGGRVAALGPEADGELIGRTVVATTPTMTGGYAEQAVAEVGAVHEVPARVPLEQAVAVFQAGAAALGILAAMGVSPGESVLVTAAAGRIGSLLVQAAKTAGARVFAAAGGVAKCEAAAGLGADAVFDYRDPDWGGRVRAAAGGCGVDVAVDAVGGAVGGQALAAVRDGAGRFGTYGFASGEWTALDARSIGRRGLTVIGPMGVVFAKPAAERRAYTERALEQLAAGRLTPRIHAVYPLEQAVRAHTDLAGRGNIGAILLRPAGALTPRVES